MTNAPRIASMDRLVCRLVPFAWDFDRDSDGKIAAHWRERKKGVPSLFDGRVLLANRAEARLDSDGLSVLEIDFFETGFSRFLAWRDFGFPDRDIYNCFAMPALRSRDGAFLLGEMGAEHSSAGLMYFPAGTPDRDDILGESIDLEGSIVRELAEEAGIRVSQRMFSPGWRIVFEGQRIACMKIIDWPEPASAVLDRVERHIAAESEPELARGHMIGSRAQLTGKRLPAFMTAFLEPLLSP